MRYEPSTRARRRCLGLTLTELMVSTAILAWMIMVANQMLVASRSAIRSAEATIRTNAEARAAATRIRQDLEQISTDGIMMIMEIPPKASTGLPRRGALSFTSVGSYQSATDPTIRSNLARIDYGHSLNANASWYKKDDNKTPSDPSDDTHFGILYRRAMVSRPGVADGTGKDYESLPLSYYRFIPKAPGMYLKDWAGNEVQKMWPSVHPEGGRQLAYMGNPMYEGATSAVASIFLPVLDLNALQDLWPYMLGNVSYLSFQWTDGSTVPGTSNLQWFGWDKDADGKDVLRPRNSGWKTVMPEAELMTGTPVIEFSRKPDGYTDTYCAFWSYKNRTGWPRALKVRMKVGNPPRPYELVVAIPSVQ